MKCHSNCHVLLYRERTADRDISPIGDGESPCSYCESLVDINSDRPTRPATKRTTLPLASMAPAVNCAPHGHTAANGAICQEERPR